MARNNYDSSARIFFGSILDKDFSTEGWKVMSFDAEQGLCLSMNKEGQVILIELEDLQPEKQCFAATSLFNINARSLRTSATGLSEEERKMVNDIVMIIKENEKSAVTPVITRLNAKTDISEILVERALVQESENAWYLNPYVGCSIGCRYCYAMERSDMSRRLNGRDYVPWGSHIDVKVNLPEILEQELKTLRPGTVRMSPIITDPYQPLEKKYRLTRKSLELLLKYDFSPVILTRAVRIEEDIALLKKFRNAFVGFSIPTDNDALRVIFEPHADSVERRFEALENLHRNNIKTFAVIQPVLPMNIDNLVQKMASNISHVRIDQMHNVESFRHLYESNKIEFALEEKFFSETIRELTMKFQENRVTVNKLEEFFSSES